MRSASAGDHAALASMRMRGPLPMAARTARTRASSMSGAKPTLRYIVLKPRSTHATASSAICSGSPGTRSA